MKRTTIRDVAMRAGVSITTVSHALSGGGALKQETRERIRKLAEQMNYMPNWSGQNLKSVRTGVIGLYVKYIRGFYGQLADFIYGKCKELGYELDVIVAFDGKTLLSNLLSRKVDGAIILHDGFSRQDTEILMKAELPTVFLDREIVGPRVSSILFDSYQTGRLAAKYLYELGHRKTLLVEGKNTYDGIERSRGFGDYMEERGCRVTEDYRIYGGFDRNEAYHATRRFLEKGISLPTAVFAANDDSAIGCMLALKEAGLGVPDSVSVVGCDNIELGQWYLPSLTTVDIRVADQGKAAVAEVVSLIEGEHHGSITKTPGHLVERASCVSRPSHAVDRAGRGIVGMPNFSFHCE